MTKRGFVAGSTAALVLIAITAAAAQLVETPKRGFRFAASYATLRAKPDAGAKEVTKVPSGRRVMFERVALTQGSDTPAWFYVVQAGTSPGWTEAANLVEARPGPTPIPSPVSLRESKVRFVREHVPATAAARGLDRRTREYAKIRADEGDTNKEHLRALAEYGWLSHQIALDFRDPYYDGKTPDAAKVVHPEGSYPDKTDADRLRLAEEFKRGIR